jgi:hypothetical protein
MCLQGAVAVGFLLFGTSLLFICSHLTAHADKVKERVHDARRIIGSLELPKIVPLRHRSKGKDFYYCYYYLKYIMKQKPSRFITIK